MARKKAQGKAENTQVPPEGVPEDSTRVNFTVDPALLQELGERLVGKPHIALAELVKNSYDADATTVTIRVFPDPGYIEVEDDGHGMTEREFRDYWMRIGSTHKRKSETSRKLKRALTGSKGVGRLSVQFLGARVTVNTRASSEEELKAVVDWRQAVRVNELTEAAAWQWTAKEPVIAFRGTRIRIDQLRHAWTKDEIEELAAEIWSLRPPFRTGAFKDSTALNIEFESEQTELKEAFEERMRKILEIYYAQIDGEYKIIKKKDGTTVGRLTVGVEFRDGDFYRERYDFTDPPSLHQASFRILVYHLERRQRYSIKVKEAREYIETHGGVRVYDGGFQLPYYGSKDADWLEIESDHSRRGTTSKLLPDDLKQERAMNWLPTNRRLIGAVQVNTGLEQELANEKPADPNHVLTIQITRDRLIHNKAYEDLKKAVRWAIDYYATREALRQYEEKRKKPTKDPLETSSKEIEEILDDYRGKIPPKVAAAITAKARDIVQAAEEEHDRVEAHLGLLGALATAGMAAVAQEHEFKRQIFELERIADELEAGKIQNAKKMAARIREWTERAEAIRGLFDPLSSEENRKTRANLRIKPVLRQVSEQVAPFLYGVEFEFADTLDEARFPSGRYIEWSAILQNVLYNAYNAMIDMTDRKIRIRMKSRGKSRSLHIEDTGTGVNLKKANELFQPFVRRSKVSPDRRAAGIGGSGLGLTIVRMIAENLDCEVGFGEPGEGYSTSFELSWKES